MTTKNATFAQELPRLGEDTGAPITVRLSNEIVTLLSSQLYQSPLKAIEELVVNSYDADARKCRVFVPSGNRPRAVLVYDDGIGMDKEGLADLWLIARSNKREEEYQRRMNRRQIGKFGIGKLATYAIANNVTYISRMDQEILAVGANFAQFKGDSSGGVPIQLPVTRITRWQALSESAVFYSSCISAGVDFDSLFLDGQSWTIVLLEDLKPVNIQIGRLRWVLSTAMPLHSDFQLFLNNQEISSSKESIETVVEFNVVEIPSRRLESANSETQEDWHVDRDRLVSTTFPEGLHGSVIVAEESLHVGKSSDLGRSHGFFVKVRDRLINEEDPLFGLSPLSYQTFNRFRADVTADDLDEAVTAPREGIGESPLKSKILPLLEEFFYEARDRYNDYLKEQAEAEKRKQEHERTYVPTSYVEYPLADVLSFPSLGPQEGAEADESWFYLQVSKEESTDDLVRTLYSRNRTDKYIYRYSSLGKQARLVQFNPEQSTFWLNTDHDLVAAYYEDARAKYLLEDLATAEAVLEVYLKECGVPPHIIGQVLERRDALLRGLANEHVFSVSFISQSLRDNAADEHNLEVALVAAGRALGFVATHIGGSGQPDGIGRFTNYPEGEKKIILEAKSSIDVPSLGHLDFAGLEQHMNDHSADGCLLVAPAYPGEGLGSEASASQRAKAARISCWTVEQLAEVVAAVETRQIGASQVLDIVLNYFTPEAVRSQVDKLLNDSTQEHRSLYIAVLESLKRLEGRLPDQARTISHVATEVTSNPDFAHVFERDIKSAIADLAAASHGTLLLRGSRIVLNASLEEVERRVSGLTGNGGEPRRGGAFRASPSSPDSGHGNGES